MRRARIKLSTEHSPSFYHCLSRVVNRDRIFHQAEKQQFLQILREYEAFCEVHILTHCLMGNHFHLLVQIPARRASPLTAEELIAKLARLSCRQGYGWVQQQILLYRKNHDALGEQKFLESFALRLRDLSWFLRLVKQRFSTWYNRQNSRKGTLWEERFRSVVVDGAGQALATMAAYIDLNPVRAGLVSDPKDYPWSGYGEAVAGRKRARIGIQTLVTALRGRAEQNLGKSLEVYRMRLFNDGHEQRETVREDGSLARGALSHEAVLKVLAAKGKLSMADYLRARVRYFCDGAIFGSRSFVEQVFRDHRAKFPPNRKNAARPMRGVQEQWFTARDLRVNVFG